MQQTFVARTKPDWTSQEGGCVTVRSVAFCRVVGVLRKLFFKDHVHEKLLCKSVQIVLALAAAQGLL